MKVDRVFMRNQAPLTIRIICRDSTEMPRVKCMYFRDDFHDLTRSALASLVPSKGGAGMQSKVFEPLCRGIPIIANSAAISGYTFNTYDHYWNGNTVEDIIKSIEDIIEHPNEVLKKTIVAKDEALSLFYLRRLQSSMNELIYDL